jgi:hypothetical protein
LDVPVSELVTERTPPDVVLVRARDVEVLSSNTVDLRLMRRMDIADTVIEIYDQRVRPGTTQTTDGHPGKEHVLVTSGQLRVGPIEKPYELGPGDYVCFPGSIPHLYETVEGEVSSVLVLEYPKH